MVGEPAKDAAGGEPGEGGDAACWAHLVCPECGAVESEGHVAGCSAAAAAGQARPAPAAYTNAPMPVIARPTFRVLAAATISADSPELLIAAIRDEETGQ